MAAVKEQLNVGVVSAIGAAIHEAWPGFELDRYDYLALSGLESREVMARVDHVGAALAATMPTDPEMSAHIIRAAVAAGGLPGWASLPVNDYIAKTMVGLPAIGLPLLAVLTSNFSAEFALRAFLLDQLPFTLEQCRRWAEDDNEHVRRLASEGTRPRLPWGRQVRPLIDDPSHTSAIVDTLFDDESLYVRRSVANHLNDVSKDHPEHAVRVAQRWLERSTHGDYVARHGLRTLVKRGDGAALTTLGFGPAGGVVVREFSVSPEVVKIGSSVSLRAVLHADSNRRAAIDYRVHYQGARGPTAPKVFKFAIRTLSAGVAVAVQREHAFQHVSIRTIRPGRHTIDLQVNGRVAARRDVEVVA